MVAAPGPGLGPGPPVEMSCQQMQGFQRDAAAREGWTGGSARATPQGGARKNAWWLINTRHVRGKVPAHQPAAAARRYFVGGQQKRARVRLACSSVRVLLVLPVSRKIPKFHGGI